MRILYFTEKDSPHDRRFLSALAQSPHQVFALRQKPCKPETPAGVIELSWPAGQSDWAHWQGWERGKDQLLEILLQIQPDLVHAGPVQGPALLTALTGFHPLVTMSWGSDILLHAKRSPWMRFASKFTLDHTDLFFADCQVVVNAAVQMGMPISNIISFPWGVDLKHFSPDNGQAAGLALRKNLGWEDQFIILCNRTWSSLYGVDVLVKAFLIAVQKNDNLRLLLPGDGPQSVLIRQLLAPVSSKISLPGWIGREDLPGAYCAADLFVSPSHSDGSSISLLEAMACGCPVLISDIASNREWVTPGEVGALFSDGDVESLTNQLLKMAQNPNLDQYGDHARQLVAQRADWEINFQKLLCAYQILVPD